MCDGPTETGRRFSTAQTKVCDSDIPRVSSFLSVLSRRHLPRLCVLHGVTLLPQAGTVWRAGEGRERRENKLRHYLMFHESFLFHGMFEFFDNNRCLEGVRHTGHLPGLRQLKDNGLKPRGLFFPKLSLVPVHSET